MIGLYDDYLRTKAAFEERFPDKADEFPPSSILVSQMPAFLKQHMPDINWDIRSPPEAPALIRNYPKGAEAVSEAWRPTKYADYDKRPNREPYSVIKP